MDASPPGQRRMRFFCLSPVSIPGRNEGRNKCNDNQTFVYPGDTHHRCDISPGSTRLFNCFFNRLPIIDGRELHYLLPQRRPPTLHCLWQRFLWCLYTLFKSSRRVHYHSSTGVNVQRLHQSSADQLRDKPWFKYLPDSTADLHLLHLFSLGCSPAE